MGTIVMKFGGAAVATPQHFARIADLILARRDEYDRVVVVVSAMGDTTDHLITLAEQVNPNPPRREYDMLLTVGERISISLLAMALAAKGKEAISFTGSQSGIITCHHHSEARITAIRPHRLEEALSMGKIVIVAGFQGVSQSKEITTLGRGGSDTSAVALGAALGAEKVEFYKDVPGIFTEDPKRYPQAKRFAELSYEEALDILSKGSEVLALRCVELAQKNGIPLHVRPFLSSEKDEGTIIYTEGLQRVVPPIFEEEVLMRRHA